MKSFVNVILFDRRGRILLQKRDDNPLIYYPGHWGIFGGQIEKSESPDRAAIREIDEELIYKMTHCSLLKKFIFDKQRTDYLLIELNPIQITDLKLSEGRCMKFFTKSSIKKIKKIVPNDRTLLDYYFSIFKPHLL